MPEPTGRTSRWFLHEPAQHTEARVFCLPYSGCGASSFRNWPRFLDGVEFCAVQPPGRENRLREPAHRSYTGLAAQILDGVGAYLDRPYALFGHCGGALAAFAVGAYAAQRDHPLPARLFVSSQVAPHEPPFGRFLTMSRDELAVELGRLFEAMGGGPRLDMIDLSLDVLMSDLEVNRGYQLDAPVELPFPVTALGWDGDDEVPAGRMGGWDRYGDTTFRILPGTHHRFLEGPPELLRELADGATGGLA